jgi:hypothetical protein
MGSKAMEAVLETKVDKYATKAAKCRETAKQAANGSQRAMYEVLAGYYDGLATDFRKIAEKRAAA